jgi:mannose-1-phosphate guanylyltransferase
MTAKVVPVIMAGGKGTRLWPMSRSSSPKQFLTILGDLSLFQQTLERVSDTSRYHPAIIVTNADFRFLVAEQARTMGAQLANILLEPVGRNTTAAIVAAAVFAIRTFGENVVIQVMASDHEITADAVYFDCIDKAVATVEAGFLVTFGIEPSEPATGYGYIEMGSDLETGACKVARFVEKPNLAGAEAMIATGKYLWNSGMFMLNSSQFLEECRLYAPEVLEFASAASAKASHDLDFDRLDPDSFARCPDISVDYAIFENTTKAAVVPSAFAWSDLGSWDSVWKSGNPDENGNVADKNTTLINTRNSLVLSKNMHVAVQGMEDIAVIASEDAVYVGRMDEAQKVGTMVKVLAAAKATEALTEIHPTSYRPWGGLTSLIAGERFQVKRIFVAPGKQLSLQKHHHRSEHWVVVRGTAEITIGETTRQLTENQSVYIPLGEVHRLANPGKILLELIEVQTGSYFGDDDIVRLADEFGRS